MMSLDLLDAIGQKGERGGNASLLENLMSGFENANHLNLRLPNPNMFEEQTPEMRWFLTMRDSTVSVSGRHP